MKQQGRCQLFLELSSTEACVDIIFSFDKNTSTCTGTVAQKEKVNCRGCLCQSSPSKEAFFLSLSFYISPTIKLMFVDRRNFYISPNTDLKNIHIHKAINFLYLHVSGRPESCKIMNNWSSEGTVDTRSKIFKENSTFCVCMCQEGPKSGKIMN